jgi:hypothetical protein
MATITFVDALLHFYIEFTAVQHGAAAVGGNVQRANISVPISKIVQTVDGLMYAPTFAMCFAVTVVEAVKNNQ